MTTWRLTYLGVERSKVNLRHSAAPSVFSSKSVLYKKNTRPGLFMRRLIPPTAVETSSNFTARKMMVHWLNKIVNSCYFTIKIFNWLPRLKLTESDCLGYPGTSTLASHTLNRIPPPMLTNPCSQAIRTNSKHRSHSNFLGQFCPRAKGAMKL